MGLLTLVDPYEVPLSDLSGGKGDEEVSVVLAGSDPIGRVGVCGGTPPQDEAFLIGNGGMAGSKPLEIGEWSGDGGHVRSHDQRHHDTGLLHRHKGTSNGGCNGKSRKHASNGHSVVGKAASHGAAAVGGGEEEHGHEHHVHAHHGDDDQGHGHGHDHGHDHGHGHDTGEGGGCRGHGHGGCGGGKSMNLWAVLVHAIADAISSGIVCAQGTWPLL